MSLMGETIDYNQQPNLTWKLPMKKCIDIKSMEILSGETVTIQLANATHLPEVGNLNCPITTLPTQIHIDQRSHCEPLMILNPEDFLQEKNDTVIVQKEDQSAATAPLAPKKNPTKPTVKKKGFRLPIDGTHYHSQQLGLRVPPKKTLGIKGSIIHRQAREVINNVFTFMKDEAQNGIRIPISNYRERVLRATGISKCTYSKITTREFQRGEPQPTRKKKNVKVDNTESVTENDSIYRPKINRDASTPDGVYNLEDLVEAYILDTLAVEAGIIIENRTASELGFCQFCTSNMNKILADSASEEQKIRRLTIFLYINYLIKFMVTPMKNITKKFVVCDKSVDVNNHILEVFSESGQHGRTRPLHMKDKALCYIMILAAIAMDFEVDVELLSKDLKIGIKKAVEVARILAFNAKANNKHVVQLKLPLPAPVTYTPKKRGR